MKPTLLFPHDPAARESRFNEIRRAIDSPMGRPIWEDIREAARRERDLDPYTVSSLFPGRDAYNAELMGMDWTLCKGVSLRMARHALLYLLEEDAGWLEACLRQAELLFDDDEYPAWNHFARMENTAGYNPREVHLRTGMLATGIGLILNWLRPHLSGGEVKAIVEGLHRRAFEPFWAAVEERPWWLEVNHNWLSCIVGGIGIGAMACKGLDTGADAVVDYADPLMEGHLKDYGPEGEFNEGLGYAGAIHLPVDYYAARLGMVPEENRLAEWPFPQLARFYLQMTVPPGHLYPFGDGRMGAPLKADWIAAVAAANQDPILQDYYLRFRSVQADPAQLFYLDAHLDRMSPEGALPRGIAYSAHGAWISSRSSWDWSAPASVVGSKARREDNHEHNDPGQVVIFGYGEPLVVDWGTPDSTYPKGFFTEDRFRYYDTQAFGHNVLVFGGREMRSCYELHPDYRSGNLHGKKALHAQGKILSADFEDTWGGQWVIDTTEAWDGVSLCRRSVLHMHPGFIVVLDEALLEEKESISLRWNTIQAVELRGTGRFTLERERASLAGCVETLDSRSMEIGIGWQRYEAPWNEDPFGNLLPQREAPYLEFLTTGDRCRILTLFAVQPGCKAGLWEAEGSVRRGRIGERVLEVAIGPEALRVSGAGYEREWTLAYQRG